MTYVPSAQLLIVAIAVAVAIAACVGEDALPTATPAPPLVFTATPLASPTLAPSQAATQTPGGTSEPAPPQAPAFSLPTGTGETFSLDGLLEGHDALALVFYRTYN